jgi:ribokinase
MKQTGGASYDVITVGAGVIDSYVKSRAFELEKSGSSPTGFETCLPTGGKLTADDLVIETGGGATNAATTNARLGKKTAAVIRVGTDTFGRVINDELHSMGIKTEFVQIDKKRKTGQSFILLAGTGARTIITYRGASAELDARDIPWQKLHARWYYVSSLAGNTGLLRLIADRAEQTGAKIAWNPGGAEIEKGLSTLSPLIRRVDILILNREEAALLSEEPVRHLSSIMAKLANLPRVALLVSDGPKGAYLSARGCTWYAPPLPGRRVNTTGAGDALGSGFVAGFMSTCDLTIAMKLGMMNALGVITHMGAKQGILREWPKERDLARVKIAPAKLRD